MVIMILLGAAVGLALTVAVMAGANFNEVPLSGIIAYGLIQCGLWSMLAVVIWLKISSPS
jgi:hypothetical protein